MNLANRPMTRHANDVAGGTTTDRQSFTTTHWSALFLTRQGDSPQASEAVEKLCRAYWLPLCGYVRRQGFSPEEAQDLTQAFFTKLLEKNFWIRADPLKGRFRSLLLTALRQFVADQRDRAQTAKRGGGIPLISLDERSGEARLLDGQDQNVSVEQQFDRQWAAAVLEQARARLREECIASGKSGLYDRISLLDDLPGKSLSYAQVAGQLGMSVSAIKSAVLRMRERYGELVREEVAHTVSSPAEVDGEIRHLLSVLGG
jgi:DNA-directed RNA polymerase specialized sigma24 family protein